MELSGVVVYFDMLSRHDDCVKDPSVPQTVHNVASIYMVLSKENEDVLIVISLMNRVYLPSLF